FFFSSRRRHTRSDRDWSSDVCSSDLARQFLERMEKPDVDSIEGISPAIAIRQKNSIRNPRSTVGTTTEIHDYLRLLYARVGRTRSEERRVGKEWTGRGATRDRKIYAL